MNTLEMVKQFHIAFGHPVKDKPDLMDPKINALRISLLREEVEELAQAVSAGDDEAVLDALTDIQVVLDGAYLALGFHRAKDRAFETVHKANMAKLGPDGKPVLRADGKIMKPEGWQPPNHADTRQMLYGS